MKRFIFSLLAVLCFFIANSQNYSRIAIPDGVNKIKKMAQIGIPVDDAFLQKDGTILLEISTQDIQKLAEAGINYNILIPDVKEFYKRRIENSSPVYTKETPQHFTLGSMGGNLTFEEMLAQLDSMRVLYPNLITEKMPISDTLSHENRPIYFVKISDNADVNENEPEVLFTGLHHAREPVSMMQLIYLMWWMLENYGVDEEATYFVDNFEIYFVPCVNPDGYVYNQTTDPNGGGMWRKNRRDNQDGSYGVDLNRNYSFNWGYDDSGSSPSTSSDTYRGPSPASEPETKNMISFVEKHDFKLILNHHTYSNLLIYPYGYDEVYPEGEDYDIFKTYARIMTRVNGYSIGTPWELLYAVNGDANDWAYGTHKIYAMTPETGNASDGFWPSQSRIIPLCEENMEMNKFLIRLTGAYAEVQDIMSNKIPIYGFFKFNIQILGQDTNATFKVYLTGNDVIYSDTAYFANYHLLQIISDSIEYLLDTNLLVGDNPDLAIAVDNGKITYKTHLDKEILKFQNLLFFDGTDISGWQADNPWGITQVDYHSAPSSYTDSPNGYYDNQINIAITSPLIDLSDYDTPLLSFWTKWDLENNYDFVYPLLIHDDSTEESLDLPHTTTDGNNQHCYTGTSSWVNESASLPSEPVKIRFRLVSDYSVNEDGFYFDDFAIITNVDNQAPVITGQNDFEIDTSVFEIPLEALNVSDQDDSFPDGFAVLVYPGEHYTIPKFNTIKVDDGYDGQLQIPVKVIDGFDLSNMFVLNVNYNSGIVPKTKIKIAPNPASSFVRISSDKIIQDIIVCDIAGKTVFVTNVDSKDYDLQVKDFDTGIYLLKIKTSDGIRTGKLIIK